MGKIGRLALSTHLDAALCHTEPSVLHYIYGDPLLIEHFISKALVTLSLLVLSQELYLYAVLATHPGRTLIFVNAISYVRWRGLGLGQVLGLGSMTPVNDRSLCGG